MRHHVLVTTFGHPPRRHIVLALTIDDVWLKNADFDGLLTACGLPQEPYIMMAEDFLDPERACQVCSDAWERYEDAAKPHALPR